MTPKPKNPLHFFNSATQEDVLTLNIMDAIGEDLFGSGITAKMVSDAISQAGSFSSITLNINSMGGDSFEGVAICNVLKSSGKPVNISVIGLAASAASTICMAGDTCVMEPGSVMMIHEAMLFCMGYAADLRKAADVLDTVTSSVADLYVAKTKMSKTKMLALMAAETWMEPKEAVEMGFATEVGSSKKTKAAATNAYDLSVFKNVPVALQDAEIAKIEAEIATVDEEIAAVKVNIAAAETDPLISILRHRLEMLRA
jgi:ATP-dependent Clp protease protease subunit